MTKNLNIRQLSLYIAKASQIIINEMKQHGRNLNNDEFIKLVKKESLVKQEKCQENFDTKVSQIRKNKKLDLF